MKLSILSSAAAIALLLAGCDSKKGGGEVVDNEVQAASDAANAMAANAIVPADPNDPARLQALIDQAMPAAIQNAKDAQYRNVRAGAGGAVCGEVAPKPVGRAARVFRTFVINPDGMAVVAATPKLAFNDPTDFVADAWVRWCASPEELQRLAPQLRNAASNPAAIPLNNVDAGAVVPDVPPEAEPAPPPTKAAPSRPPPPAKVDSFFNSVQHKD